MTTSTRYRWPILYKTSSLSKVLLNVWSTESSSTFLDSSPFWFTVCLSVQNDVPLNKSNLTPHLILFEYQYEFLFPTDWKLAQCVWWHPLSPHHWLSKLLWLRSAASAIADAVQCAGCQVSRSFLPTSSGLTVSAKQRRRIQSRNGPGKKLSLLLSFGYLGASSRVDKQE